MSDLFDQIAKLKSRIHCSSSSVKKSLLTKSDQTGSITEYKTTKDKNISSDSTQPYPARGSYRGRSGRGRGRGGIQRNSRTLIVNNNVDPNGEYVSVKSASGYKLVNKQLYEEELKKPGLSDEEKLMAQASKILQQKRRKAELRVAKIRVRLDNCDRCIIDGHLYAVSRYGAKLTLLDPVVDVPIKSIQWGGYSYKTDKAGNLKLEGQKVFLKEQCRFFQKTGQCSRGTRHNHECPDYQLNRECPRGKKCQLSHNNTNNLDAKLEFSTLEPSAFQLPNLTQLENIHEDPRIHKSEIVESSAEHYQSSSEDEDDLDLPATGDDNLEIDADFIHF
ncbi:hypothetical protein BON22_2333 [Cyberlindnera fabianii]|uniref:C3H1-type domain-containing protein n=1 Tax=Cyberlindnera fabianii TaxID=36022 RepID=A0A1V2L654_CYBFA|nr:hypothetical protein BON22_2333 [Cyberlindnera fabianii]